MKHQNHFKFLSSQFQSLKDLNQDKITKNEAWIIAIDMGYGHQRTAYSLRDIAFGGEVINANHYVGIPVKDKNFWRRNRLSYEFISRIRQVPIIGLAFFLFFDIFQRIFKYYPKRDLSKPRLSSRVIFRFIEKGWGRDLIEKISKKPLPLITTFFTPAFTAEKYRYPNDIYCVICDADIARVWAPLTPDKSRIKYLVPNTWTRDRLKLYGIKPENIILTGYPLPKENIGGAGIEILKKDLGYRIINLDPKGRYRQLYAPLLSRYIGELPRTSNHPLTLMFSIGGAGAQKEIALKILKSLEQKIKNKELRIIISIGLRENMKKYFEQRLKGLQLDGWARILFGKNMKEYFAKFNEALRTTDILMTKPSELSFYAGLGIPIIIEPSIGSQEDFNRKWLLHIGAAVLQENPKHTNEWLFDLLNSGDFAEMAMQGFVEIEKMGTYNIERIIRNNSFKISNFSRHGGIPLRRDNFLISDDENV